jgi:TonB family protein
MVPSYITCEVHQSARWSTFFAGLVLDLIALTFLVGIGSRSSTVAVREPLATSHSIRLVAPVVYEAPRPVPPPAQVAKLEPPKLSPLIKHMRIGMSQLSPVGAKAVRTNALEIPKVVACLPPSEKPAPAPAVKPNVFASAKSDTATAALPARKVQTGGFGDPTGLPSVGDPAHNTDNTVSAVRVGSFTLPQGPGQGNGTSGSGGAGGVVRSSGFSDRGTSQTVATRNDGGIKSSGFGDAAAQTIDANVRAPQKRADLQPVQIIFKPSPEYTAEARRRRVEGEVLLDVVFTASGSLHINRVVKGLGYGLDDKALAAAEQIRFHPAMREGQPYDCAALVHIRFELAE